MNASRDESLIFLFRHLRKTLKFTYIYSCLIVSIIYHKIFNYKLKFLIIELIIFTYYLALFDDFRIIIKLNKN